MPAKLPSGSSNGPVIKPFLLTAIVTFTLYFAHRLLQLQYYRHCRADLIRVVLFNQSPMCTHISSVINVVEVAYHQVIKNVMTQVMASLNGVGNGLIGQLAAGMGQRL
jgi:hypothetical protein